MSLIIKHKDIQRIVFPAFLLSSSFLWAQERVSDTAKVKTKEIDEVVIIAYGSQKKGEVTGAVGKVDTKSFKDRPIARVDQALTGQIAGVKTRATSGKPGEPLEVRVRGTASISANNSPVYVVDGMVVDDIANIAPDDVQSIDVLKDAASTAMYGSRGSNGVVIVTTKKGTSGKPAFSFSQ